MLFNIGLFIRLNFLVLFRHREVFGPLTPKRLKRLFFWYTVMPLLHILTSLGFLLDDLFFPAYRQQKVERPIFILSNFRSGSTLLHRLLARDEANFTAMKTWEIYLAPSITQRVVVRALAAFDHRWLGGLGNRWVTRLDQKVLGGLPMHRMGLHLVDEDEGILIHNWTSTFLVFVFPHVKAFRPFFFFDDELNQREKQITMSFYKKCIQRHVYFHGGKQYIAKSPSFSVKLDTLLEYFPDADFIYLARNPVDMVASKTHFFAFCWDYFNDLEAYPFRKFILEFTRHWYLYPLEYLSHINGDRWQVIKYNQLTGALDQVVEGLYRQFDLTIDQKFAEILRDEAERSMKYVSRNRYSLNQMDYTPEQVYENYREIFERFDFSLNGKAMLAEPVADALIDIE